MYKILHLLKTIFLIWLAVSGNVFLPVTAQARVTNNREPNDKSSNRDKPSDGSAGSTYQVQQLIKNDPYLKACDVPTKAFNKPSGVKVTCDKEGNDQSIYCLEKFYDEEKCEQENKLLNDFESFNQYELALARKEAKELDKKWEAKCKAEVDTIAGRIKDNMVKGLFNLFFQALSHIHTIYVNQKIYEKLKGGNCAEHATATVWCVIKESFKNNDLDYNNHLIHLRKDDDRKTGEIWYDHSFAILNSKNLPTSKIIEKNAKEVKKLLDDGYIKDSWNEGHIELVAEDSTGYYRKNNWSGATVLRVGLQKIHSLFIHLPEDARKLICRELLAMDLIAPKLKCDEIITKKANPKKIKNEL